MSLAIILALNDAKKRCGALNSRHELYPRFSHVVKNKFSGTNPLPLGARFSFGLTPSGFVCLAAVEEDLLLHRTLHPLQLFARLSRPGVKLDIVQWRAFLTIGDSLDADFIARAQRQTGDSAPGGRVASQLHRGKVIVG